MHIVKFTFEKVLEISEKYYISLLLIMNSNDKSDSFWKDDVAILWQQDRLIEFYPTADQTTAEKMNAIVRFGLYFGIILAFYENATWPLFIPIFILALTLFIFENYDSEQDIQGKPIPREELCSMPTNNNPLMNHMLFDPIDKAYACSEEATLDDPGVKEEVNEKFMRNLYLDVNDLFQNQNSQRQFYTTAPGWGTMGRDQDKFAQFLFGDMPSCKANPMDCHPYERLQQKRFIFPNEYDNPITSKNM